MPKKATKTRSAAKAAPESAGTKQQLAEANENLMRALRATREGYEEEVVWHRFLIDSYTGCGGFAGRVRQPLVSWLGWAAEAYSDNVISRLVPTSGPVTYLDQYPREDDPKFQRRRDVAWYMNYVEPIIDTLTSYVLKRVFEKVEEPDQLKVWRAEKHSSGMTWDACQRHVIKPRTALLGWMPILIDTDKVPEDAITRAATDAAGIKPRVIPLYPVNLLDFETDPATGEFVWVKLCMVYTRRPKALGPSRRVEEYSIWTRDNVQKYEIYRDSDGKEMITDLGEDPHGFGEVPVVISKFKPTPDQPVVGLGMADSVAIAGRRLFNLLSEFDEHLRSAVFAMLQVPMPPNATTPGEIVKGNDQALLLFPGSNGEYRLIEPSGSVAATYEVRIAAVIREIYRIARDEFEVESGQAESGLARQYQFEKTNRKIGDFAEQLADSEERALKVVARGLGVANDTINRLSVKPPTDFNIEDLSAEIKKAMDARTLELPPTAWRIMKKRLIALLLQDLSPEDEASIDSELEEQDKQSEQDKAMEREGKQAEVDTMKMQAKGMMGEAA